MKRNMNLGKSFFVCVILITSVLAYGLESTRVTDPTMHARKGAGRYPHREKAEVVLKQLDLRPGDVVADIGAGDGFWSEKMAEKVGPKGTLYALEVKDSLVKKLEEKFAKTPQVKSALAPFDSTGLGENTLDLAFFSQVYHHVEDQKTYLQNLRKTVKPTGRLVIIEKYNKIATNSAAHASSLGDVVKMGEETGWIPVRCELLTGTYHFIAIFVQRDMFPPEPVQKKQGKKPTEK